MHDRTTTPPLFTQVDISPSALTSTTTGGEPEQTRLLRDILTAQDRQNELLEELVNQLTAPHLHIQKIHTCHDYAQQRLLGRGNMPRPPDAIYQVPPWGI